MLYHFIGCVIYVLTEVFSVYLCAQTPVAKSGKLSEATDALMVLGYSRAEAMAAMKDMDIANMELEEIIRLSLKRLM